MWKCLDCGDTFEQPERYMGTNYCPYCHIDDINELHLCHCERKYITDEQDRCDLCEMEIDEAMKEARERITNGCRRDFQGATEDIVWWIEREG